LLRAALAADAAASGTIAFLQLMAPHVAARAFGLPVGLVIGSSVLLGAWSAALFWLASGATVARALVVAVILGNLLWSGGCVALAVLAPPGRTLGLAVLILQAAGVVAFAAAQAVGLRQSPPAAPRGAERLFWRTTL
jgi:hypothetical protein